jgi:hypothetical protein
MSEPIYFLSPIWIISAIISFFLADDWEENPWTVGVMALILGPIILIIYILGKLSNIGSQDRAFKKGKEIQSKKEDLLEQIKINKPNIISKIEELKFENDLEKRNISKEHLQELINNWKELGAISQVEHTTLTNRMKF